MTSLHKDENLNQSFSVEADSEGSDQPIDLEEYYLTVAQSVRDFADSVRQAVINFEYSREDLVKVSLAVDMMANSINLLRNYVNFYIDEIEPSSYESMYTQFEGLASELAEDYLSPEEIEQSLKDF